MSVQFEYQGFDVLSQWSGALTSASATAAFSEIASVGSNTVGISPKLLLATGTSSTLVTDPTQSTSDAALIAGIQAAQADGLKVILEPVTKGLDGTVSSALDPSDPAAFFASYKTELVHLATIAQATGVDTLSLGDELSGLTGSQYRSEWLDIIAAVRQVYSGKITYEAATTEASSVSFWDKVDTIGVNAYLTLSASSNPTVSELETAWTTPPADNYTSAALNGESMVDFLHSLATTYGKQVLITEVGYRSIDGSATNPGDFQSVGTASETDQANAYQALFQVMQSEGGSWFAGLNFWEYSLDPNNTSTNYSPVGKTAMDIVQQYFSGDGSVSGLTVNGSATNDLIDIGAGNDTINAGLGNDIIRVGAGNDTIVAGPGTITTLKTTTVVITGYGALGSDGAGGKVAVMVNGQQVGATVTFTPAADTSGYQTYTITFTNPDQIKSFELDLLNASTGANAMIRSITINGASLSTSDVTNVSAPGTFNLYNKPIQLDTADYQDWFYGTQSDNDLIEVGSGNDTVDGGAGVDTVVFKGSLSDYSISKSGDKLIVTGDAASGNGKDTLTNIEYLQFADQTVAVASLIVSDSGTTSGASLMAPLLSTATVSSASSSSTVSVAALTVTRAAVSSTGSPQITVTGVSAAGAAVTLYNGSTALGTATAGADGSYSLTLSNVASGVYTLTTAAAMGGLTSAASNSACLIVGSAATIAGLIASTSVTPSEVYLTDPSDPIAVSVAQLRTIAPALAHAVTSYSLAVSDTASNVLASLDFLGTETNLSSITLTDTHVFNVTLSTMKQIIANDAAVLSTIQGGYSFVVNSTGSTGSAITTSYDQKGVVTSTKIVATTSSSIETYIVNADGSTSDTFTTTAGVLTSQKTTDASGKRFTQYGITGKPYASQTLVYDTAGKVVGMTQCYASGVTYSAQTVATDGTTTTKLYDTAGHLTQQTIVSPSGSTDVTTYDASSAKLTDKVTSSTGTLYTQYGVTGKPYATQTLAYNTAGKIVGMTQYYASGLTYSAQTVATDGTTTTKLYDTAGHLTQQTILLPSGSTDVTTYAASGAKLTDKVTSSTGTLYTQYGVTGKSYVTQTLAYNTAGKIVGMTQYYASGVTYSAQTVATDGTTTTKLYDTTGNLTQQTILSPSGSTDVTTYAASGAKLTDKVTSSTGTLYTQYGITGKPYATQTLAYDTAGKIVGMTQYYASGVTYSAQTVAASGATTTKLYNTSGQLTQQTVVSASGSTDVTTYAASGAKLTDKVTSSSGTVYTQYGITGKPYATLTTTSDTTGKQTGMTEYFANGTIYSTQTVAADGSTTTKLYNTSSQLTQQTVVSANGATDVTTYDGSGNKLTDKVTDSAGTRYTQYSITGKSYTTQLIDYDTKGNIQDVVNSNTDGSKTTTLYAAGLSLSFSNANDKITSAGGETLAFASTPFHDTIQSFQGGDATGHDTIVLSKSLVADYSHLTVAQTGTTATVTIDSQHVFTLTNTAGSLSANDFRFV